MSASSEEIWQAWQDLREIYCSPIGLRAIWAADDVISARMWQVKLKAMDADSPSAAQLKPEGLTSGELIDQHLSAIASHDSEIASSFAEKLTVIGQAVGRQCVLKMGDVMSAVDDDEPEAITTIRGLVVQSGLEPNAELASQILGMLLRPAIAVELDLKAVSESPWGWFAKKDNTYLFSWENIKLAYFKPSE